MGFGFAPLGFYNKKSNKQPNMISPEPYAGSRPYSADEIGFGAPALKGIGDQYLAQLKSRAVGEGTGFDPAYSAKLKQNFLIDLNDQEALNTEARQAQASSQGLRGGIPLTIAEAANKNYTNARTKGLNSYDIADLEAKHADQNQAIYAQPQAIAEGAGFQQNRANFDLAEYNAEQPTYIDQPPSNVLPALIGAAGTIGGAYVAGPAGAAAGGQAANLIGQSYYDPTYGQYLRRGKSNLY